VFVRSDWLGLHHGFCTLVLIGSLLGVPELGEDGHGDYGIMVVDGRERRNARILFIFPDGVQVR